jgi:tricorn protease-like protein
MTAGRTLGAVGVGGSDALRVFISYRREDSVGMAGRIRDRLVGQFGPDNVFFDIDTIPLGVDFRQHIDRMVAECDVVLVVIGRRWVDAVDAQGQRRLDQRGDFVRLEVEAALRREIPVIPLLVDGATIPEPHQLPAAIAELAYRNGTQVRHDPDFHPDVDRLVRRLGPVASPPAGPDTARGRAGRAEPSVTVAPSLPASPSTARSVLNGHTGPVSGCAVAPDGTWIVSVSEDATLRIWDVATGEIRRTLTGPGPLRRCAVAPDGTWIVSASTRWGLQIWDAATGAHRRTLQGHSDAAWDCAVAPDGTWIVSAFSTSSANARWGLRISDVATGEIRRTMSGDTGPLWGCAVAPDGTWVASASADKTLRIWDVATGETRRTLTGHTEPVLRCAVAPDGTWLLSAAYDKTLRIWDVATGETRRTLTGHTERGFGGCAVAPDGTWALSASTNKKLQIWDVATGETRGTLTGHSASVEDCCVAPDGTWIVSASADTTLRIWDV